ncbi:hypothetical protein ES705_32909 [subsurface metagenome]
MFITGDGVGTIYVVYLCIRADCIYLCLSLDEPILPLGHGHGYITKSINH